MTPTYLVILTMKKMKLKAKTDLRPQLVTLSHAQVTMHLRIWMTMENENEDEYENVMPCSFNIDI